MSSHTRADWDCTGYRRRPRCHPPRLRRRGGSWLFGLALGGSAGSSASASLGGLGSSVEAAGGGGGGGGDGISAGWDVAGGAAAVSGVVVEAWAGAAAGGEGFSVMLVSFLGLRGALRTFGRRQGFCRRAERRS